MNRSLLIVENDPDELEILSRGFVGAGYGVVSVHHPRLALEAARVRQFPVAVLDAALPEMDGVELLRRLKRLQEAVHVVMIAGDARSLVQARADGAFACRLKPCRYALLEEIVEDAFEQAWNESRQHDQRLERPDVRATFNCLVP
jgi:two-component system response regulator HydG